MSISPPIPDKVFELAYLNLPSFINKEYFLLSRRHMHPKELQHGQLLLGVEIITYKDASESKVNMYPIQVIGFCNQEMFDDTVISQSSCTIRAFTQSPVAKEDYPSLYARVSEYKTEYSILETNYEKPSLVAKLLEKQKESFLLLQATESVEKTLCWKNDGRSIYWFKLHKPKDKFCVECDESFVQTSFKSFEDPICITCTQKQTIIQWLNPKLRKLAKYMFSDAINEMTFENNSLYIHTWFGSGKISDYKNLLPDCFEREEAGSFEGMSQFGGPSAYSGRTLEMVSSALSATLYLAYDAEHGMVAKLWVEPETAAT